MTGVVESFVGLLLAVAVLALVARRLTIPGTARQQVGKVFHEIERALQSLPPIFFPVFEEALRTVHRDDYLEFKKAYYSAPPEYVGRQVWLRQETHLRRLCVKSPTADFRPRSETTWCCQPFIPWPTP